MKIKINGYLPVFSGFYGTLFEFNHDALNEQIENDISKGYLKKDIDFDNIDINNAQYEKDVSIIICDEIEKELIELELIEKLEFEKIKSPMEYNFSNDVIYCKYIINTENYKNIIEYIKNNKDEFSEYIKDKFTDRSGFISFYSNDPEIWLNQLINEEFENIETQFSVILDFIVNNEDDEKELDIYYKLSENDIYESAYLLLPEDSWINQD